MKSSSLLVLALTLAATAADARPRPNGFQGRHFESNKTFGLGLELGSPTSITGKYFLADDRALDFGVGYAYNYLDYRGGFFYLDHEWYPTSLASTDAFELPFYVGVGGALWNWEYNPGNYVGYGLGVRVPVGLAIDFNNVPLEIFFQLVPTLDFLFDRPAGYNRNDFVLVIDGSIGIRYYFN